MSRADGERPAIYRVTTRRADDGGEETFSFTRKGSANAHLEFYREHTPEPFRESRIVEDRARFRVGQWVKGSPFSRVGPRRFAVLYGRVRGYDDSALVLVEWAGKDGESAGALMVEGDLEEAWG